MLKILIPVNGSELSLDAVRHALGLRRQGLDAEFVLANVQEPASLYEMLTMRDPQLLEGVSAGAGEHLLEGARQLCNAAGASYECEVGSGDPAHTLLDIAERYACDMIIIGGPGPVSRALAEDCPVPVTVIKRTQTEETPRPDDPEAAAAPSADGQEVVVGLA